MNRRYRRVSSLLKPRYVLASALFIALLVAANRLGAGSLLSNALTWIGGLGPLAPAAFIIIYILACVLFIPGSILTIGAGILFGLVWGTIYVSIAATLGATCAFLIGRYAARDWVAAKLEGNPKFKAIDEAVAREGWKIVGLTRLSPIFPFNLLNYAFGLTSVSLVDYFLASWAGMIPGTIMYVYIGSLAGDLTQLGRTQAVHTPARWALDMVGFIARVVVVIYVTRIGTRALRART
jgi:uncharacterized membrane protein YdjX (TVP38/TMEM64 family)